MLKVTGMLATSQGTLMKLLEISNSFFAVFLAICMIVFHLTQQKKKADNEGNP